MIGFFVGIVKWWINGYECGVKDYLLIFCVMLGVMLWVMWGEFVEICMFVEYCDCWKVLIVW